MFAYQRGDKVFFVQGNKPDDAKAAADGVVIDMKESEEAPKAEVTVAGQKVPAAAD